MKRILATVAMLCAVATLTTGCMKFDISLDVSPNDTVNGSMIFAISNNVIEALGSSGGDTSALDTKKLLKDAKFKVDSSVYKDDKFTGTKFTFQDVPLEEFNTGDSKTLSIARDGDNVTVSGNLDLAGSQDSATIAEAMSNPITASYFKDMAITISVTLPGEIKSTNGKQEGNKITWTGEFGKNLELQAVAHAPKSNSTGLIVGVLIATVVIAGLILAIQRNKKKAAVATGASDQGDSETPIES